MQTVKQHFENHGIFVMKLSDYICMSEVLFLAGMHIRPFLGLT
jgi:hypothetical protein